MDVEKGEGEGYVMGPVGGMDSFLDKVRAACRGEHRARLAELIGALLPFTGLVYPASD